MNVFLIKHTFETLSAKQQQKTMKVTKCMHFVQLIQEFPSHTWKNKEKCSSNLMQWEQANKNLIIHLFH